MLNQTRCKHQLSQSEWKTSIRCLTLTTQRSTIESSHSMYASMGDCSSNRRSNSWYTVTGGRASGYIVFHITWKLKNGNILMQTASLCINLYVCVTSDPARTDLEEWDWSELKMLHRVFQGRVNLFNLLVSINNALTLLVVGMIVSRCVVCVEVMCKSLSLPACVKEESAWMHGLTVDNKLPVLLLWVLHSVKCLLGDAVQVHIPPVLQHLKGDVSTVYHSPRRLGTDKSTILLTQAYQYPLSAVFVHMDFIKKKTFRQW